MTMWFRWHEGTTEDGKFRVVARNANVTVRDAIALWAFMLEDASSDKHRGVCTRNEDFMSAVLEFEDGVVERILSAFEDTGMISVGIGCITVSNWSKRQFEIDHKDPTNADRQRRYRELHKNDDKTPTTQVRNAHVTVETLPDTETDNREEKKEATGSSEPVRPRLKYPPAFEGWWLAYPKTPVMSKKEALTAWNRLSEEDRLRAVAALSSYIAFLKSNPDHPVVHACRFLSQRRFDGFLEVTAPGVPGPPKPPSPNLPSHEELLKRYSNERPGTSRESGEISSAGRAIPPVASGGTPHNNPPRIGRMASLGEIFPRIPGVRAGCDEADQHRSEQGKSDDGPDPVARVVRF